MKNFKRIIVAALALVLVCGTAAAQLRFGVKAGVNVNSLHFSKDAVSDVLDSNNRTGFTGGLMTEFTVPLLGLGFDASLMYTHKVNNIADDQTDKTLKTYNNDYLEIPINLKYKFSLPMVGGLVAPYLYTGPSFAFLCSKKDINEFMKNKSVDVSWNIGAGVQLLNHLQISAAYGFGINKAVEFTGIGGINATKDTAKTNCWTVTAAYLF